MHPLWKLRLNAAAIQRRVVCKLLPSRANIISFGWPLLSEECPCDLHFCAYLRQRNVVGKSVFHFGSGSHHVVGLRNRDEGLQNEILSITLSPKEHRHYVRYMIRDPLLGRHYKVLLADIYDLSRASLPQFDVVTLFHLCEYTPSGDRHKRLDDSAVLDLFLSKLTADGRVLFYPGSHGYDRARPIIEDAVSNGRMVFEEQYEGLLVYRSTSRGPRQRHGLGLSGTDS